MDPSEQLSGPQAPQGQQPPPPLAPGLPALEQLASLVAQQQQAMQQQQQALQQMQERLTQQRAKLPPPPKTDGRKPSPIEWTYKTEAYLIAQGYVLNRDRAVIAIASAYFEGPALLWHLAHTQEVALAHRPDYASWDEFKTAFISRFTPIDPSETARQRLARCRQTKSAIAYTSEFDSIILNLPNMDEADKLYKFLSGLKPAIQMHVTLQRPTTLAEAQNLAIRADSSLWAMGQRGGRSNHDRYHHNSAPRADAPADKMDLDNAEAKANAARPSPRQDNKAGEMRRCWYCGRPGHIKPKCRKFDNDRRNGNVQPDAIPRGSSRGRRDA